MCDGNVIRLIIALILGLFGLVAQAQAADPVRIAAGPNTNLTGFARQGNAWTRVGTLAERTAGARTWQAALAAGGDIAISDAVILSGPAGDLALTGARGYPHLLVERNRIT